MNRLPTRSEIQKSFFVTSAIINFWAFIIFFYNFPGLTKQLKGEEILAMLAYILASSLFESIIISAGFILLSVLFPVNILRKSFSIRTTIILLMTVIYIIPFHTVFPRLSVWALSKQSIIAISIWALILLVAILLFQIIISKNDVFTNKVASFVERISILGTIYVFLDTISLAYVIAAHWI